MAGKIFISYRRSDDPGFAHAIYGQLEAAFGSDNLFMDVEGHIKAGDDFVQVLNDWVAACDVLLAVIGEGWTGAPDEQGNRRLERQDDFVRIEIAAALESGKRVIPVLVGEAEMPRADELPQPLKVLARRNAVAIRPTRFKADSQGLVNALKDALDAAVAERAARTEAERLAAEEERRTREAEEIARAKQLERAARDQAMAGLSREEIRKAEELANWEFIKGSDKADEFRDHLARFSAGPTERYARARLETLVWADLSKHATIDALRKFLAEFPKGENAAAALRLLRTEEEAERGRAEHEKRRQQETEEWGAAAGSDTATVEAFLKRWPNGQHAAAAKARLKELRGGNVTRRGALRAFAIGAAGSAGAVASGGLLYWAVSPDEWPQALTNRQGPVRSFTANSGTVRSVAFSPDGRFALSGSTNDTLKLWDVTTAKELRSFRGHSDSVNSVTFSPDGRLALSGSGDHTLKLWDTATAKELRSFTGHSNSVTSVAFSPDGRLALSGSWDNSLKLWDALTGKELRSLAGHSNSVWSVTFSPDGRLALSGSEDRTLRLWDVAKAKELRNFAGHASGVNSVAFSPDGRFALSGSDDNTLKLWDVAKGKELRGFTGHSNSVTSVAFSPDGRFALSGSWDNTLKLWEVATATELCNFTGHFDRVRSVTFSPDGRFALSGSADNTLKLWDVSTWTQAKPPARPAS